MHVIDSPHASPKSTNQWVFYAPQFESDEFNSMLAVSPWSGHRRFAYDFVAYTRPRKLVELGTHYGCSFFSFLQAAKDLSRSTQHVAVDTWVGEDHAGHYSSEVYDLVLKTIRERFAGQSTKLLRMTFDEALLEIDDDSVDLLHIDGFHSFEAVEHDYSTWLRKLAPNGAVFFHDVDPSSGYGSAEFWKELKKSHPHFEFLDHSFGLGILFPRGGVMFEHIRSHISPFHLNYYKIDSNLTLRDRQYHDAQKQLQDRWQVMQGMEKMIKDRDDAISSQANMLEERWRMLETLHKELYDMKQHQKGNRFARAWHKLMHPSRK